MSGTPKRIRLARKRRWQEYLEEQAQLAKEEQEQANTPPRTAEQQAIRDEEAKERMDEAIRNMGRAYDTFRERTTFTDKSDDRFYNYQ